MLRRDFLQKSSLLMAGAPVARWAGLFRLDRMWDEAAESLSFSLNVVTDRPGVAARQIDRLLSTSTLTARRIHFDEVRLSGSHVGDIALVRSNRLIDFRRSDDTLSRQLTDVARSLSLPTRYDNPTLLRFYGGRDHEEPQSADVFCGEILLHQLPLSRNREGLRVDGSRGYVDLSVWNGSVRITGASCRHRTCVELGAISRPGQTLVCIPSQISVVIEGRSTSGVDSVTY